MAAPKLKPKEKPEIKRIETDYKSIKALRNFICGINFILLGLATIAVQNGMETTDGTAAVTLLVSPMQANILAELEENGDTHIALVYRGTAENAAEFIKAQETVLSEIEEKILAEKEKQEAENGENTENTEENEENILTETDDTTENNTVDTEENTNAELFE